MTPRINLVPGEKAQRSRTSVPAGPGRARPSGDWIPRSPAMLVGLVALVLVLGMVFLYFAERRGLSQARADIVEAQADSSQLHSAVVRVRAMEEAQARLAAQVEVMENVVEGRLYWIHFIETLSRVLPEYTWLQLVDHEGLGSEQVRVSGASFANAAITELMRGLEASQLLENVTLVGVSRVQQDSVSYQGFTLVADYENYAAVIVVPPDTIPVP